MVCAIIAVLMPLLAAAELPTELTLAVYDRSQSDSVQHPELEIRRHVDKWLDYVAERGLDRLCAEEDALPEGGLNASAALVAPAPSGRDDKCDEFSFSGELTESGFPVGRGTLRFGGKKLKSKTGNAEIVAKACLIRGRVFESRVEEVKGGFDGFGRLRDGKVILRWRGHGLRAEVFVRGGVPHGLFKVDAAESGKKVLTVGHVANGQVGGRCWVATESEVRFGLCTAAFVFHGAEKVVLFKRPPKNGQQTPGSRPFWLSAASLTVAGYVRGDSLTQAEDHGLLSVTGAGKCWRSLSYGRFRNSYVYDLKTGERKIKLRRADDVCTATTEISEGTEASGEALRKYFRRVDFDHVYGMPAYDLPTGDKPVHLLTGVEWIQDNRYEMKLLSRSRP